MSEKITASKADIDLMWWHQREAFEKEYHKEFEAGYPNGIVIDAEWCLKNASKYGSLLRGMIAYSGDKSLIEKYSQEVLREQACLGLEVDIARDQFQIAIALAALGMLGK